MMAGPFSAHPQGLLARLDHLLGEIESWAVACLLGASVLLNAGLVVSRYVFSYSLNQLEEISVYLAIWLVFVGAAACDRRDQHIQLDILYHLIGARARVALRRAADLLQSGLCLYLAWLTLRSVLFTHQLGEVSLSSLRAPVWALMSVMPPVFLLLALRAFGRAVLGRPPVAEAAP